MQADGSMSCGSHETVLGTTTLNAPCTRFDGAVVIPFGRENLLPFAIFPCCFCAASSVTATTATILFFVVGVR